MPLYKKVVLEKNKRGSTNNIEDGLYIFPDNNVVNVVDGKFIIISGGGSGSGSVSSVDDIHPDATGNVKLGAVRSVNSIQPDADGNVVIPEATNKNDIITINQGSTSVVGPDTISIVGPMLNLTSDINNPKTAILTAEQYFPGSFKYISDPSHTVTHKELSNLTFFNLSNTTSTNIIIPGLSTITTWFSTSVDDTTKPFLGNVVFAVSTSKLENVVTISSADNSIAMINSATSLKSKRPFYTSFFGFVQQGNSFILSPLPNDNATWISGSDQFTNILPVSNVAYEVGSTSKTTGYATRIISEDATIDSAGSLILPKMPAGPSGGASVAKDMYFATTAERDAFTTNNPARMYQGVTSAVDNAATYDYYQWDETNSTWLSANLIFQGKDGQVQEIVAGNNITVDASNPARPIITSSGSTGKDPAEGFDLNPNTNIGLDTTSAVKIKNNAGTYTNAVDQDSTLDAIRLGSQDMKTYLRTNEPHMEIQTTTGMKTIAHLDDIPLAPTTALVTERVEIYQTGSTFIVPETDLSKWATYIGRESPQAQDGIVHINIPSRETFEAYFWFEGANDSKKDILPPASDYIFSCGFESSATGLRLSSTDNSIKVSGDTDIITKQENKIFTFQFVKQNGTWDLAFTEYDVNAFVPSSVSDTAYSGVPENTSLFVLDGKGYSQIDRQHPVITDETTTPKFRLLRISVSETSTSLAPTVKFANPPELASGFSFYNGSAPAKGDTIIQISSGTYSLADIGIVSSPAVGVTIYVQLNGTIDTAVTDHPCGWVVVDGAIIDIDIYNASCASTGSEIPNNLVVESLTANLVKTPVIDTDTTVLTLDVAGQEVAHFTNNSLDLQKTVNNGSGFDVTGIYRLTGSGDQSSISLPNDSMVLYAEREIVFQDTMSDYVYINRQDGFNFAGTSAYLKPDYDKDALYIKGDVVGFKDRNDVNIITVDFFQGNHLNVHSHKIENLANASASSDAITKGQVDTEVNALKSRVATLESEVQQQRVDISSLTSNIIALGNSITILEASNGNSVTNFVMYSENVDEVRMDMDRINGQGLTQTITLGNNPPPTPPAPPLPDQVTVYYGWDINEIANMQASDFENYQSTDERSADLYITKDTLTTTTLSISRANTTEYKYSYIAYPKGLVDPDPMKVTYSGFTATWINREITIGGFTYIVLVSEYPNVNPSMDMKVSY